MGEREIDKRKFGMINLLLKSGRVCVAMGIFLACVTAFARADSAPARSPKHHHHKKDPMVMPTDDDRALAARFRYLFAQLDVPGHPGREAVNNARLPWIAMQMNALDATHPVPKSLLDGGRGTARYLLPQMEAGQHLSLIHI